MRDREMGGAEGGEEREHQFQYPKAARQLHLAWNRNFTKSSFYSRLHVSSSYDSRVWASVCLHFHWIIFWNGNTFRSIRAKYIKSLGESCVCVMCKRLANLITTLKLQKIVHKPVAFAYSAMMTTNLFTLQSTHSGRSEPNATAPQHKNCRSTQFHPDRTAIWLILPLCRRSFTNRKLNPKMWWTQSNEWISKDRHALTDRVVQFYAENWNQSPYRNRPGLF